MQKKSRGAHLVVFATRGSGQVGAKPNGSFSTVEPVAQRGALLFRVSEVQPRHLEPLPKAHPQRPSVLRLNPLVSLFPCCTFLLEVDRFLA